MKIFIFTLCCVILTLPTTSVGGTLKDVLGKVKTGAQKVEEDVKAFFHLNKKSDNQQEGGIVFRDEDEVSSFTTKPEEITTKAAVPEITTTTQISTTTIESSSKGNGTTRKDGRENFTGGCVTGYLRTPDGRCKPTF